MAGIGAAYAQVQPDSIKGQVVCGLGDAQHAYQSQLSSAPAQWQPADALAMPHLDALLSMEAGAMGVSKDNLMRDLFFASLSSSTGT